MLSSYRDSLEPIASIFQLKSQEEVEIEFHTSEGELVRFNSRVSNSTKRGVSFELDQAGISAAELIPGHQVFIALIREDALYGFDAKVQKLTRYPVLVVNLPDHFYRIQRREYFRLRVSLPLQYTILGDESQARTSQEALIVELSAHGLRMLVEEDIPPDTALDLHFVIPSPPTRVAIEGAVLRVTEQEDQLQLIAFYPNAPEKTRDVIMQYLMTEQRALLRGERMP